MVHYVRLDGRPGLMEWTEDGQEWFLSCRDGVLSWELLWEAS